MKQLLREAVVIIGLSLVIALLYNAGVADRHQAQPGSPCCKPGEPGPLRT